ncbi:efflux transporter outer membrane subunit [Dokdonella sp.]|uniref:efflux transporter outer membrane subunit n=1 Tax=Dokdonella sp. TaxID=2291710 RepID=UPI003784D00A
MAAPARRLMLVAACVVALAACSIPPKPDRPALRDEAPLAGVSVPDNGTWPDAQWWKRYADPQLDRLVEQALAGAPTLDEAHKRLTVALSAVEIARAQGGLSSQANGQVQRQRLSENGLIPPRFLGFTWYNQGDLSLQFQYDFDFWGKTRAAVAAAVDEARAAQAERSAASLMLTSAIADTYFGWQSDQAHLALAGDSIVVLQRYRALSVKRVDRGIDQPDLVHQADARLAGAREMQAGYAGAAKIRLAALAGLLGVAPADLPKLEARPLPAVDAALPGSVGLDLLARRPDIAASRWRVEAAMRRVDQARAQFYPDISLGAMVGLQSVDLDKLLTAGSRMGGIGPAVHLPIFGRGQLKANYAVSQAQLDAAASQYDATVVDAARDVATQALSLAQIDARRRERQGQIGAIRALEGSAAARVRQGVADDRSVLAAQAQVIEQRDAAITLDAQAISTQIALTKALGGGYHVDADPLAADANSLSPIQSERADAR